MVAGRFRFGLYEFDAAKLELRREGVLVRLQSQPAQLLATLLDRGDQVVSREELRAAIWGDKTFVDFENGLNFCISQVRLALQDDPAQPRFIRTIPKRGYQFIAPVQRMDDAPSPPISGTAPNIPSGEVVWQRIALVLALVTLTVLTVIGLRFRSVQGGSQSPILAVARFDNETGDPALQQLSDALTDAVVVQLASRSRGAYRLVGNAAILRVPREQRDLKAIQSGLGAGYVVLGQVQGTGKQVRVLAHLIRLADQTHIWVTRTDAVIDDPMRLESEIADKIAGEFSAQMVADPAHASSFRSPSH